MDVDQSSDMDRRQLAVVLGVHRSGTSLLAAGLSAIGAKLGNIDPFAEEDNPKGYFEHAAIRDFNDELMRHIGITWDNWGFYSPQEGFENPKFDDWRQKAVELLQQCFDGPGHWGLKEPRMTMLLPFWNTVFSQLGWNCKRIIILRHPDEVAESQRQRFLRRPDHFKVIAETEPMHALWAVTMHGVLTCLPDDETYLVRHEDLYDEPESTLLACAGFLGLSPDPDILRDFAAKFVAPSLRRAGRSAKPPCGAWGDLARGFYSGFEVVQTPGRLTREDAIDLAGRQHLLKSQLPFMTAVRSSIGQLVKDDNPDGQQSPDIYVPSYGDISRAIGLDAEALAGSDVIIPTGFLRFLFEFILRLSPFDEAQYRAAYADLAAAEKEGRIPSLHEHFLKTGWYEGRLPGEHRFDESWYRNAYEDIAQSVLEGRLDDLKKHFNEIGRAEGRVGSPEQARWKILWDQALKGR